MSFNHTAETDARICQGYEAGERVLDIANALGVSRNVVIGRANRLGLQEPGRQYSTQSRKNNSDAVRAAWASGTLKVHPSTLKALQAGRARYWAERKAAQ